MSTWSISVLVLLSQVSALDIDLQLNNEVLLEDQMPLVMLGENHPIEEEKFAERYRRSFYR